MTHLPIVETLEGDLTGYVQSNLVSMTDGQIMVSAPLFGEGQKPAVDLGLSVSRVGSKVQWPIIKKLSGPLRLEYLQYREVLRVSKLKTSGSSDEAENQLKAGGILTENRQGQKIFFPLLSLSVGLVDPLSTSRCKSHVDIADLASEAKKQAKKIDGNSFFINRRNCQTNRVNPVHTPELAAVVRLHSIA